MTATFLVKLDIDITSPDTITNAADDIFEACMADGLPITECTPWDRPSMLSGPALSEDALLSGAPFGAPPPL